MLGSRAQLRLMVPNASRRGAEEQANAIFFSILDRLASSYSIQMQKMRAIAIIEHCRLIESVLLRSRVNCRFLLSDAAWEREVC